MYLAWPLLLLLLVPIFVLYIRRLKKPRPKKPLNLAESKTLKLLPSYKKIALKSKVLKIIELITISLIIVILVVLASRPQATVLKIDEQKSRDIVLCLDISPSMKEYHLDTLDTMRQIVASNPADKYSIVIFGNTSFAVIPLTRDVASINLKLNELSSSLNPDNFLNELTTAAYDYTRGVDGTDIGEGMLGCIKRFSNLDTERSRYVVMLSDMEHAPEGTDPIQIAKLYAKYGINLHIVYPESFYDDDVQNSEVVKITNAKVSKITSENSAKSVISSVYTTIQNSDDVKHYVRTDNPQPYYFVLIVLFGALVVIAILREGKK